MFSKSLMGTACAAMLAGATLAPGAAAQPTIGAHGPEIVVEAPRSVPLRGERSPYTGAPVVVTTVKIPALYGDLDLAKPADAARLMKRLERVARSACLQLDQLYPLDPDPECVHRAVSGATASAKTAIAAAKAKAAKARSRRP